MPLSPGHEPAADASLAGPLGGLLLSVVRPHGPMFLVRAIKWYRDLDRLGIALPFFLVHDVGLIYAAPTTDVSVGVRAGAAAALAALRRRASPSEYPPKAFDGIADDAPLARYLALIEELAASDASRKARNLRLGDELVTVILARLLGAVTEGLSRTARTPEAPSLPFDPDLARGLDARLPALFASTSRAREIAALIAVEQRRLHLLTLADTLDVDTLRLLGILGPASSAAGALAQVDLLAALAAPGSSDIVRFSLELLPTVLETKRSKAPSASSAARDGYAGIGSRGSLDSLVLTELAWDEDELARRFVENEVLYYTREQPPEDAKRLHYLLIDASASMRGEREVFARGVALALAKKLQLSGEEVWIRFFDSRLYDAQKARQAQIPASYVLGFKGERGRNPARVFAQLATELALVRTRERKEPFVHLITHASLHVPRALVADVRASAHLYGIFILPSGGPLALDYLDMLEGYAVVDHATLRQGKERATAATKIVDAAAGVRGA